MAGRPAWRVTSWLNPEAAKWCEQFTAKRAVASARTWLQTATPEDKYKLGGAVGVVVGAAVASRLAVDANRGRSSYRQIEGGELALWMLGGAAVGAGIGAGALRVGMLNPWLLPPTLLLGWTYRIRKRELMRQNLHNDLLDRELTEERLKRLEDLY